MEDQDEIKEPLSEASAMFDRNEFSEAATAYQAIVDSGTKTAAVYRGLGNSLCGSWKYDEAVAAFKEAINLDEAKNIDPDPAIYDELGDTLYQLRRFREAIENYEKTGAPFLAQAERAVEEA